MSNAWIACVFAAMVLTSAVPIAGADELSVKTPEQVGLSTERLDRLDAVFEARVRQGHAAGYVIAIARGGQVVYSRSIGDQQIAPRIPMQSATLFRIASMTKPVTAVAVLTLIEQGKIGLNDPVKKFLPEMGAMKVREADGSLTPQKRDMTIRDLFTHTSGIGYRFDSTSEIGKAYIEAAPYEKAKSLEDAVKVIAAQPLYFQPGERVLYSYATDVLGRVVEVVSGEPFEVYLKRVIFDPLDMRDTAFTVRERDRARMASVYSRSSDGALQSVPGTLFGDPFSAKTWPSGGAGLISTARDYLRFATMLERGGALGEVRILSPASIALMTSNHLPNAIQQRLESTPLAGVGMGLGVAVVEDLGNASGLAAPGDFAWGGHYDTQFFVSPHYDIAAVIMTQRQPTPGEPDTHTMRDFKNLVLAALK